MYFTLLYFTNVCILLHFPPWLHVTLLHFSRDRSKLSSQSFSNITFQNFPAISDLLSAVSKSQHNTKVYSKCSTLLVPSLNLSPVAGAKSLLLVERWYAMTILDLISRAHLATFVNMLYSTTRIAVKEYAFWPQSACTYFVWFSHYRASVSLNTIFNWLLLATHSVFCKAAHQRWLPCRLHFTIKFKIPGPLPQMRPDYLRPGSCYKSQIYVDVDGFTKRSPSNATRGSPGLEWLGKRRPANPTAVWVIPDHRTSSPYTLQTSRARAWPQNRLESP
jgi:hypothetical protein